jgi:hypothetical protein
MPLAGRAASAAHTTLVVGSVKRAPAGGTSRWRKEVGFVISPQTYAAEPASDSLCSSNVVG